MIPTRPEIQAKIYEYYNFSNPSITLEVFISEWLDSIKIPETITHFGDEISPKQQILADLESYYVEQSAENL